MIEISTPGTGGEEVALGTGPELPARLPVLPLRDTVAFPDTLTPLAVGQERSIQLINDVLGGDRMLALVLSREAELDQPGPGDLHAVGVAGTVARMLKVPDGTLRILVQAGPRIAVTGYASEQPYLVAEIAAAPDELTEGPELTALMRNVQETFGQIVEDVPYLPEELQLAVANLDDPSALAHLIAGSLRISAEEKQALLEERDVGRRLRRLSEILARELEVVAIGSRIQSQVQSELDKTQREYVLRQQLKAIQDELGERDPAEAEVEDLREQLAAIALPRRSGARPTASWRGSRSCRRRRPSTASSAATSSGSRRCRGTRPRRTTSTSPTRARCSTPTTTTSRRSRTGSSSSSPSAGSSRTRGARSCASSARPASARPRSASRSRARSAGASSASRSAACATRPRSAATGAPTSAPCRA